MKKLLFTLVLTIFIGALIFPLSIRMNMANGNVYDTITPTIYGKISKIKGEVTEITAIINGKKNVLPITLENNNFSVQLTLKEGENKVMFLAKDKGGKKKTKEYLIFVNSSLNISLFNDKLYGAHDLAFDGKGNVYVSCTTVKGKRYGGSVWKIDSSGKLTEFFKPYSTGKEKGETVFLDMFKGIEIGKDGNIYLANESQATILKITPSGKSEKLTKTIFGAYGLAFGPDENLYITSRSKNEVYKLNVKTKEVSTLVTGSDLLSEPTGIVYSPSQNCLFVTNRKLDNVVKITLQGKVSEYVKLKKSSYPRGLTVDSKGNLYVCATQKRAIVKVDTNGNITLFAKRLNWSEKTMFKDPTGIEFGDSIYGKNKLFVTFKTNLADISPIYTFNTDSQGTK